MVGASRPERRLLGGSDARLRPTHLVVLGLGPALLIGLAALHAVLAA